MAKFRYYILHCDMTVSGTNDSDVARKQVNVEETIVIDICDNTVMMPDRADGGDAVGDTIEEFVP